MEDLETSFSGVIIFWHNKFIERLKELTDPLFLHSNGKLFHSLTVEGKKEL